MAGGESSDCHIVPTGDNNIFRLRVRLSPPKDDPSRCLSASTVIAGCRCHAFYWPARTGILTLALWVSNCATAKVSAHMVLLDKTGTPAPSIGIGKSSNVANGGFVLSARRDHVKANCVVGNYFVALCSVDIGCPPDSSMENELPDLGHHLAIMSGKQELTDVSFDVGGESFSAHCLVLAARSPVFRAELYGPMAESKMTSIPIKDMEASTFRTMLHYMYHGSLPNAGKIDASITVAEYQHLLIAADRYGIERLKKNCEDKLSVDGITINTVVSMLELAEDHVCSKLKARCLDFLADADNFKIVGTTGEYICLMQSFPHLLVEVQSRIKIAPAKSTIMSPGAHKKSRGMMMGYMKACPSFIILFLVYTGIFLFLV
ncbi:BTB/POZ and MATH domain-containing protein 1-like [Lolium rigidum]|uniref:BTB/POZ and MATH domain-containing protein 1-like n=1 Tax=Lolium rigidum TaxID=89674 RepID=UPI001F5D99BF|nr:BTB/POZ and MATH domain-containing protein 1-like [Lolium rigidum]